MESMSEVTQFYFLFVGWLCGKEALYMESMSEEQIAADCQFYFLFVGWLCGKEALYMESMSEEQIAADCQTILKKFLKKDIPKPNKVLR